MQIFFEKNNFHSYYFHRVKKYSRKNISQRKFQDRFWIVTKKYRPFTRQNVWYMLKIGYQRIFILSIEVLL